MKLGFYGVAPRCHDERRPSPITWRWRHTRAKGQETIITGHGAALTPPGPDFSPAGLRRPTEMVAGVAAGSGSVQAPPRIRQSTIRRFGVPQCSAGVAFSHRPPPRASWRAGLVSSNISLSAGRYEPDAGLSVILSLLSSHQCLHINIYICIYLGINSYIKCRDVICGEVETRLSGSIWIGIGLTRLKIPSAA